MLARARRDHLRARTPAMYVQGVENVYDPHFNGRDGADRVSYGDVFLQNEQEFRSTISRPPIPKCCSGTSKTPRTNARRSDQGRHRQSDTLAVPAYEQVVKASPASTCSDARGVISVQERQSYILRIRELAGRLWRGVAADGGRRAGSKAADTERPIAPRKRGLAVQPVE